MARQCKTGRCLKLVCRPEREVGKFSADYDPLSALAEGRYHPLPAGRLSRYIGQFTPAYRSEFSQKVGSTQYATITCPDAAKSASHLAKFLANSGPRHIDAVSRSIQQLYSTRFYGIMYESANSGDQALQFASDASFGDHKDRKSSGGFLCELFGGAID